MAKPSETVSVRLDTETLRLLDQTRDPFGDSRGEYVRRTVVAHLLRDEEQHVHTQIAELRMSNAALEEQLGNMVTALKRLAFLLFSFDGPVSADEAMQLIGNIFPDHGED